jgi:protein-S-isoprenylcysteine O-methyltransferase Ste14
MRGLGGGILLGSDSGTPETNAALARDVGEPLADSSVRLQHRAEIDDARHVRTSTAALGLGFMATAFVAMPAAGIQLNSALGWPLVSFQGSRVIGGVLMLVGIGGAIACSHMFRQVGRGTPIPIEPAQVLIASGLYRYSRNPIYVADLLVLVGLALHRGEFALFVYAAMFAAAVHAWVVHREEPVLAERFGDRYRAYCDAVPRWIGRARPVRADRGAPR